MLLVIPSIDMKNGICCNLIRGESGSMDYYEYLSEHPAELCKLFRRENSKTIQINDIDSFSGKDNTNNLNAVLFIADIVDIPVQFNSNIRSVEKCRMLLDHGIYRVIISGLAFTDPYGVRELLADYTPSRIALNVFNRSGNVMINGFSKKKALNEVIKYGYKNGFSRILYGNNKWQQSDDEVDTAELKNIEKDFNIKITVNDGVKSPEKLWELEGLKSNSIDSAVIGEPFYNNNFPCQHIWRSIESEIETY